MISQSQPPDCLPRFQLGCSNRHSGRSQLFHWDSKEDVQVIDQLLSCAGAVRWVIHERTTLKSSIPVSGTVSLNEWLSDVDIVFSEPGMDQLF